MADDAVAKGLRLNPRTAAYVAAASDEGDDVRVICGHDLCSLSGIWPDKPKRPIFESLGFSRPSCSGSRAHRLEGNRH